jgi:hypothetical protein
MAIEMKKVSAGKLRAIGYDAGARVLQIEFDDGRVMQYQAVGQEMWRRLSTSGSMSSYFRDNIEEEFTARRVR